MNIHVKVQNQIMIEMLSKAFNRKQTTQNLSSKHLKNHKKENFLTAFKPKHPCRGYTELTRYF